MNKCTHGVLVASSDWELQQRASVPAMLRIAWHCYACRPYGLDYSEDTILRLARERQLQAQAENARDILGAAA